MAHPLALAWYGYDYHYCGHACCFYHPSNESARTKIAESLYTGDDCHPRHYPGLWIHLCLECALPAIYWYWWCAGFSDIRYYLDTAGSLYWREPSICHAPEHWCA